MPKITRQRGKRGDPNKPCGYCKRPKDNHTESCKYGPNATQRRPRGMRSSSDAPKVREISLRDVLAHLRANCEELERAIARLEDIFNRA